MKQVADNMWVGQGTAVNWLLVREGSDLTLVDSGYPADFAEIERGVRSIGQQLGDIKAVLLTHAHVDHMGGLNELWRRHRVPVLMHPDEVPFARGEAREQASPVDVVKLAWRPSAAVWLARIVRSGALNHPQVAHARAWGGPASPGRPFDSPLDLPGRPVPVPCAGHTPGHTAYLFPECGVVATGDALVTGHPTTGKSVPHVLPSCFNTDDGETFAALDKLAEVDANTMVPGHGDVWRGPMSAAVEVARSGG